MVAPNFPRSYDPRTVVALRIQPPLLGISPGGLTLINLSLAARFAGLLETELGANSTLTACDSGGSWYTRLGVAPSVLTARANGSHWNLRIPVLASYVNYSGTGGGCDDNPGHDYRGYLLSTGLDATHWGQSRVGFNMRLLVGAGSGYQKDTGPHAYSDAGWTKARDNVPEITFTLGIVFR
jgi:hypothetical protein